MANNPNASQNAMPLHLWWKRIYPHAIQLEKKITLSPTEYSAKDAKTIVADLKTMHNNIQDTKYPDEAASMREHLLRATHYLHLAYEELQHDTDEEIEFYYSSALLQVAQLHTLLVQHGFTN